MRRSSRTLRAAVPLALGASVVRRIVLMATSPAILLPTAVVSAVVAATIVVLGRRRARWSGAVRVTVAAGNIGGGG